TFIRIDHLPELDQTTHTLASDDASIIGHTPRTCDTCAVADAHNLPAGVPYQADHRLARLYGYHRKSLLAVPMLDHLGQLVGVLVFANRKSDPGARITTREDAD